MIEIDQHVVEISRRKSRALLYFVAGHVLPQPRARLLSIFWPDLDRPAAQQTLRTTLHGLRQALGAHLEIGSDSLGLAKSAEVDVRAFEGKLSTAQDDAFELEQALECYRGDFLQDFSLPDVQPFEDWLTIERERYRRLAIRGLAALATLRAKASDYPGAIAALEKALVFNPLQEDLQREVIRLYYLAGDRPGAIQRYDDLRRLLDEQMGVPPMIETRTLYDAILKDRLPVDQPGKLAVRTRPLLAPARAAERFAGELPFVGREAELALLNSGSQEEKLVLILGEPGIGKTRLAEEFLRAQARQSGSLALTGHGRELEQALPYHPVIEALRGLTLQTDWAAVWARLRPQLPAVWLGEIARLLPELTDAAAESTVLERPAEEARLWEGVRQFMALIARLRPLSLFLNDLQWADGSSLALLSYLVRQARGARINFLATARPAPARSPYNTFLQSLLREGRLRRLELSRLSQASITQIAHSLSQHYGAALGDWLGKISEGNPFILVELVREAYETGLLTRQGELNLEQLSSSPPVPQTVYSLIQSRLAPLSEAARRVLDAAVAAGRAFEFEIVMQAAGLSENAALDALDELQAAGLVSPLNVLSNPGKSCFSFDHVLTIEVAYHEVGELRHRLLHRRVAEALEARSAERLEQAAGELAWHFAEGNALQRAAPYAMIAGRQAAALAAWNEAAAFYSQALLGLEGPGRLQALTALADVYSQQARYSQASEALLEALLLAQPGSAPAEQINALQLALARSLIPQGRYTEVTQIAERLCASGEKENAITAELLWGTALSIEGSDLQSAELHLRAAQALADEQPNQELGILAQIRFELGSVLAQQGDLVQAVDNYRQSLQILAEAKPGSFLEQRILAHNNLAFHLHLLGDASAREIALQGLALAQEKGVLGLQAYLYSTLGEIALAAGELEQAEEAFNQGLVYAEQGAIPERTAGLTANLGLVAAQRGESALAIYRLSNALGQADALGARHLSVQIRLWLVPLLPAPEARHRLDEARRTAEATGRLHLLEVVKQLQAKLDRGET